MNKLLNLKDWFTVTDAARHLSSLLEEDVREADVLRFALDARLKLSVFFPKPTPAFFGTFITVDDVSDHLPGDRIWCCQEGEEQDAAATAHETYMNEYYGWSSNEDTILIDKKDKQVLQVQSHCEIAGIFDLTIRGGERDYLENQYQRLIKSVTGQPEQGLQAESIPVLSEVNQQGSAAYGLLPTPDDFFPKGSLLVVRTTALQELETVNSTQPARPLAKRERDTLLVIIAALAKLAKIDLTKPSSAAASIERQSELMGTRVAARTIENHLNRISDALEDRGNHDAQG